MTKRFLPTPQAYELLHTGQLALSQIEATGVRIDKAYLEHALADTAKQINVLETEMRDDPDFRPWRRRFGTEVSFTTNTQLAAVVFGDLGFQRKPRRSDDKETSEQTEFEGIKIPLVRNYFEAQKLRKGRGTYLLGIQREMVQHDDGLWYVHPSYHLNTVATFRSSCSDPNYQNLPNRNPLIAELIRRCYISRPGQQLLEIDLGQIEVRVPCFYCHDPALIAYNTDPTKDMHRDMAAQIFFLTEKQAKQKNIRHIAKNRFVFPTFYGGFYKQNAPAIWETLALENVKIDGTDKTVIEHLAENGITELGDCDTRRTYDPAPHTFECHLQQIEKHFWQVRFPVYAQWKKDWVAAYHKNGGCMFLTGFPMIGPHAKNDITNYCVQSVAFHIPLWAITRINRILRRYSFVTRIIGEVHDCINFDGPPCERDDVIDLSIQAMTKDVVKHWPWINVPLVAEPECCPVEGSWYEKISLVKRADRWVPADAEKWAKNYGEWR
jgi:DNA polymerase I-like protein with 3'-5' exonuclease and polymerase domains